MPEPSNDSLRVEAGVMTGNGAKSEPSRVNMEMRGPRRDAQDQLTDTLGGFHGPEAELMGLPFGSEKTKSDVGGDVAEQYKTGWTKMPKT